MEHYSKFDEVEEPCEPPFAKELVEDAKVMDVHENTRVANINRYVSRLFQDPNCRRVVYKGVGEGMTRCISCVEVLKDSYEGTLYQWNVVKSARRTDIWKPVEKASLHNILVHVEVPVIFILVSRDPFPECNESCQTSVDSELTFKNSAGNKESEQAKRPNGQVKSGLRPPREPTIWTRAPKKSKKSGPKKTK